MENANFKVVVFI